MLEADLRLLSHPLALQHVWSSIKSFLYFLHIQYNYKMNPKINTLILLILCLGMITCFSDISKLHAGFQSAEVAGIIISFRDGHSYDNLFSSVKQKSKEGSVVLTYLAARESTKYILEALGGNYEHAGTVLRQFVGEVDKLTENCPSCIVFNWQCSSGFSDEAFDNRGKQIFGLLQLIIKRGYLAMFSDFSLKALIKQWNTEVLGPNPFEKVGETSSPIKLKFNKDVLLRSPSSQLQAVAHLAANDQVIVHTLGGTIIYGVDSRIKEKQKYELEILTVASNFPAPHSYLESKIGEYTGLAGHVLLSYKNGGKILTSMGHWIELMKIDTSSQKLFETTERLYGQSELNKIKEEYGSLKTVEQKVMYASKKTRMYIQEQSPGSNRIYNEASKKNEIEL